MGSAGDGRGASAPGATVRTAHDREISRLSRGSPLARVDSKEERAMTVSELMTPNPVTVTPQASLADVWDLMRDLAIRHVPVLDRGALVGMGSDRDSALDLTAVSLDGGAALRDELTRPVIRVM
jgi:CBS domain-containing protein